MAVAIPLVFGIGGAWLGGTVGGVFGMAMIGSAVGYLAGHTLGAMIVGPPDSPKVGDRLPSGYPIQGAMKGPPRPVVFGTTRLAGNVVEAGPLESYTVRHTSGGKGGFGGGQVTTQVMYRRSFYIDICHGPAHIIRIWKGKRVFTSSAITTFTGDGVNIGLEALIGKEFCNYRYSCGAHFNNLELGASGQVPNFVFEVSSEPVPYGGYYQTQNALYYYDTNFITQAFINSIVQYGAGVYFSCIDIDDANGRVLVTNIAGDPEPWYIWNRDLSVQEDISVEKLSGLSDWVGYHNFRCCFSSNGDYVFGICAKTVAPTDFFIMKWNSRTGALIWSGSHTIQLAYVIACDANDNVFYFTGDSVPAAPAWRDGDNNFEHLFIGPNNFVIRCLVDNVGGYVYYCGKHDPGGGDPYQHVWQYKLPTWNGSSWDHYPAPVAIAEMGLVFLDYGYDMAIVDSSLFVSTRYNEIYKLDDDLVEVTHISLTGILHIYTGPGNTLCALYLSGGEAYINIYDSDLVLIETVKTEYDGANPAHAWTSNKGATYSYYAGVQGGDANPAYMIKQLITSDRYGLNRADLINTVNYTELYDYYQNEDLLLSMVIDQRRSIWKWIDEINNHVRGWISKKPGKIILGAWRDETPPDDAEIDTSYFKIQKARRGGGISSPIRVKDRLDTETANKIILRFISRDDQYDECTVKAEDRVDQAVTGSVRTKDIKLHGIHRRSMAEILVWRFLWDYLYRCSTYSFICSFKAWLYEQGDVIYLTDSDKINRQRVRILGITEEEKGKELAFTAVDDLDYLYKLLNVTSQATQRDYDDDEVATFVSPNVVITEDIDNAVVWLHISPANQYCNGCHIYVSWDDVTYDYVGQTNIDLTLGLNGRGVLTTALPNHGEMLWVPEESFQMTVASHLSISSAASDDAFWNSRNLSLVGGEEIIGFRNATDLGSDTWEVDFLMRGLRLTPISSHSVSEIFQMLSHDFAYLYKDGDMGKTLYVKCVPFYGNEVAELSDITSVSYTILGKHRPPSAGMVRIQGNEGFVQYPGVNFTLNWNLGFKDAGWNVGGFNYDGLGYWYWTPAREASNEDPAWHDGIVWDSGMEDPNLQAVVLRFEETDETFIGEREVAGWDESEVITKATDLGGFSSAIVKVIPRSPDVRCKIEKSVQVENV